MSAIWMAFFFCPYGVGRYGVLVRRLNNYFEDTGFECHPDKTQIGRTERGFNWLGVWFDATGPTGIAHRAKENHRARRLRLEEQVRRRGFLKRLFVSGCDSIRHDGHHGQRCS